MLKAPPGGFLRATVSPVSFLWPCVIRSKTHTWLFYAEYLYINYYSSSYVFYVLRPDLTSCCLKEPVILELLLRQHLVCLEQLGPNRDSHRQKTCFLHVDEEVVVVCRHSAITCDSISLTCRRWKNFGIIIFLLRRCAVCPLSHSLACWPDKKLSEPWRRIISGGSASCSSREWRSN